MLSILIPTYNYNALPLVSELHHQCINCGIDFEIICLDDGSASFNEENQAINSLENCRYEILEQNIGRSAIRNLLAKKARFENLLFLDTDAFPTNQSFIQNYILQIDQTEKVVFGGIQYQTQTPAKNELLRWVYGKSREVASVEQRNLNPHLSLLTLHFLISKSVFEKVRFNENIPNLGHEDTLFSYDLKLNEIPVLHINNSAYHLGLESSAQYLQKSENAVRNFKYLIDTKLITPDYIKISHFYTKLKRYHLDQIVSQLHRITKPFLIQNLLGSKPSLLLFDLYRLGYLCSIKPE